MAARGKAATETGSEQRIPHVLERAPGTQLELGLPSNWREMIGPDPHRPGEDRARLIEAGIPVWAIIGHLLGIDPKITTDAIARTADAFVISISEVAAAIAYYAEHRMAIDARLAVNAAAVA